MSDQQWIRVASLAELREAGVMVVRGASHNVAVFADGDTVFAVDNRCPHMGFPLDRGSVSNGVLTCHWHQARFDLTSGCTFDLWADDVLTFATELRDDGVWVAALPQQSRSIAYYQRRLIEGMEQAVGLVQAKSLLAILAGSDTPLDLLREITGFALDNLGQFTEGLTRLGCVANLMPHLTPDTFYQALLYATRQIAVEAERAVPHRRKPALAGASYAPGLLREWLQQWVRTRHQDGTERTLLAVLRLPDPGAQADLVFGAASERLYADGGHLLESCNKAFEMSERFGHDQAERVFPLLVERLTGSRGREESTNWHHPIELVEPLAVLDEVLPAILAKNSGTADRDPALLDVLLGDDPLAIIDAMREALVRDLAPAALAREVSYAAALRLARFAASNEVTDWFNPQHSFIYTNAAFQAVSRSPTADVVRAVFHGAMSVYMDRFLNVPAARLPSERNLGTDVPQSADELTEALLTQLDQRADIDLAADIVAAYLQRGHPFARLVDTLAFATVREDLDFHSLQVLDAAVNQAAHWDDPLVIEHLLVGVVRNLAAHCPTRRAGQQTARIAARLQRGEPMYEDA